MACIDTLRGEVQHKPLAERYFYPTSVTQLTQRTHVDNRMSADVFLSTVSTVSCMVKIVFVVWLRHVDTTVACGQGCHVRCADPASRLTCEQINTPVGAGGVQLLRPTIGNHSLEDMIMLRDASNG
jgi:hypothetical protein